MLGYSTRSVWVLDGVCATPNLVNLAPAVSQSCGMDHLASSL